MKIIFCGPPHSGKSVFFTNISNALPADSYSTIRACPDGEGSWSNNPNQNETLLVRRKGEFTTEFVENVCEIIDNQKNHPIVMVDVGGKLTPENAKIFKHCDSFVILSNNEEEKNKWLQFGESLGLTCLACLDSSLEGKDRIYSKKPYLQGKITNLERGNTIKNSPILNSFVFDLLSKINYDEKPKFVESNSQEILIDNLDLGTKLGYCQSHEYTNPENNQPKTIQRVIWPTSAISKIQKAVSDKLQPGKSLKLYGFKANFAVCSIAKTAKKCGCEDISIYDIWTNTYIPLRNLPQKRGVRQVTSLTFNLLENKTNAFLDISIPDGIYEADEFDDCVLPKINKNKNLFISGRLPHWLLASITNSYDSNKIFTFQPGKGFTCIESQDEKELGKIVDGPDGLNITQYFEDGKKAHTAKSIDVFEPPTIFAKLKKWFTQYRGNKKYIDSSINSHVVEEPISMSVPTNKHSLQDELKVSEFETDKSPHPTPTKNISEPIYK